MDLEVFAAELCAAAPAVRARLEDTGDVEPDPELPTVWAGDAGSALAAALPALSGAERAAAFALVERAVASGGEWLSTVVCTGLLEALAGRVSAGELDPALLASVLGPASRAYVDAWDEFTLGRSSLEPGPDD